MISYFWSYPFARMALLAVILITPMFGMMGTLVVEKRMAFFSDALGHSALTGIAVGVVCGAAGTTLGDDLSMIIYAVVFALLLNQIKFKKAAETDTIISVFASASLAIGLAILSQGGNFSQYSALLVGDILAVSSADIRALAVLLVISAVFYVFAENAVLSITIHPTLAKTRGYHIRTLENIFAVLVAVIVTMSIRWIGILLINALLIVPAAASRNISRNMHEYFVFSIIFAMFSGIVGIFVSFFTDVATGPMIVIISAVIYFATYLYGRKYKS